VLNCEAVADPATEARLDAKMRAVDKSFSHLLKSGHKRAKRFDFLREDSRSIQNKDPARTTSTSDDIYGVFDFIRRLISGQVALGRESHKHIGKRFLLGFAQSGYI
jgi:hypothetical protein